MSSPEVTASDSVNEQLESNAAAEVRKRVLCPKCSSIHFHRIHREGFLQERFLPMFGYYPWECKVCRKVSLLRLRAKAGKRSKDQYQDRNQDRSKPPQNPAA